MEKDLGSKLYKILVKIWTQKQKEGKNDSEIYIEIKNNLPKEKQRFL